MHRHYDHTSRIRPIVMQLTTNPSTSKKLRQPFHFAAAAPLRAGIGPVHPRLFCSDDSPSSRHSVYNSLHSLGVKRDC
jgi:hypothetical protein